MDRAKQALSLYKQGHKVIPLVGKRPILGEWQKFYDVPRTDLEILQVFKGASNIGLVTGKISNITVIDIDYKNKDGSRKFMTTLDEFLKIYPTDVIVETGSGNHHLYYEYTPYLKTGVDIKELYGADVRNDGGQVVMPPSIHESGKPYKYVKSGMYGRMPLRIDYNSETSNNTEKSWITKLLEGVGSGNRDDACAKLAGYYHSKGMPVDIITSLLMDWNKKNNPPLAHSQVEKVIKSVTKYTPKEKVNESRKPNADNKTKIEMLPFNDYMLQFSDYTVDWMIDDWLPAETILFMVSPPASFKTWITIDLAVSVAGGFKFMGKYPVNDPGPVLIFQQEDHHGQMVSRLATIIQSKREGMDKDSMFMPDLPIYIQTTRNLTFDNPDRVKELEDLLIKYKPKVVIIDPLYSAIPIDDYMSKGVEYMFPLKTFRDKYKCTFVLAHHSKKSTSDSSIDRADLWGSQFLNAFLESGWQIRTNGETSIRIKRHFKVASSMKELKADFNIYTEFPAKYEVTIQEVSEEMNKGFTRDSVLTYLKKLKVITKDKIVKKFDIHPDEVSKILSLFVTDGVIIDTGDGKYVMVKE